MIKIENLSIDLGDFKLKNINLKIQRGEYFSILGPTGCGKTVLLKCVAGIYKPSKGKIIINSEDVTRLPPEKRRIGYVPQDYKLFPHLSVKENIAFGLKLLKNVNIEEEVEKLLELVGLTALSKKCIKCLSGGEKQRVALARAIATRPRVLLLDEPLSALDKKTRKTLQNELKRIHKETKITTIHVTHDFKEALNLADRVAIMNNGQIIQTGEPSKVFKKPNSLFVARFMGAENLFKGEAVPLNDELSKITVNGIKLFAHRKMNGEVYVYINPEEVTLSDQKPKKVSRNIFEGIIKEVLDKGLYLDKISVDIGMPLTVLIPKNFMESLNIEKGRKVYVSFNETNVHIIPSSAAETLKQRTRNLHAY